MDVKYLMRFGHGERGSALAMLPAFALVIIMALGFVVDGASSFMAQRALVSQVSAIASDAAELAMDSGYFYRTGEHRIDGAVATAEVRRRVAELHPANVENIDLRGVRIDGTSVVIDLEADARLIFAPAMPFLDSTTHISVNVRSTAELDDVE